MTHPNAYDGVPHYRVAKFALWSRYRVRLWELPPDVRHKIIGAAIDADPDLLGVAANVCRVAREMLPGLKTYGVSE